MRKEEREKVPVGQASRLPSGDSNPAFDKVIAAKEARRKRLAKLPIHKKVEIVVQLQKLAAPLLNQEKGFAR